MRRTSTWAWRLRPRVSWPWVASRRLSCATTRCTAARSCSGPEGSARSSSLSGREAGSDCVRSICARSSSRRRCCSKRRIWSRVSPGVAGGPSGSRGGGPPGSERSPSARRMRWTSTPSTPEPSPRRPKATIASRARSRMADSSPSRIAWMSCSRRLSKSICSPPVIPSSSSPPASPPCSRTPCSIAAASAARKKKRSNTRSNTRRSSGDFASVAASASRNEASSVHVTVPSAANASSSSDVPTARPSARSSSANETTPAGKVTTRRRRRAAPRRARRPCRGRCGA